ncbi:MAG: hypothetical protein K2G36_04555 [Ruminococcus sp.]|nr:hypothetical protein [Ruminococcus sp.]
MKIIKRIFLLSTALFMTVSGNSLISHNNMSNFSPSDYLTAFADSVQLSGECGENLTWTLDSDGTLTISDTATIYGYVNSTAQAYAEKYNRTFAPLAKEETITIGLCGENLIYTFNETTEVLTISGTGDMPDYVNNAPWSGYIEKIKEIIVEDGVTRISNNAFSGCRKSETIKILNPECEIDDRPYTINDTATIYGYANSTAQAYAEKYNRIFAPLAEKETTTTSTTTSMTTTSETTTTTTTTSETTTTIITLPSEPFTWNRDNWNFDNTSDYFEKKSFREMINSTYLSKLALSLTNSEYQTVFEGYMHPVYGYQNAMLDAEWEGSCHGMSILTMISRLGMLPYGEYTTGAKSLYELEKPSENENILSLITYYQMLQFKDSFSQQFFTVPDRSHKVNIEKIISELDKYDTVLVGYKKEDFGGHTVLAYDYTYNSWTWNGMEFDGCIYVCDPDNASSYDEEYNIYFNSSSYNWIVPSYYEDYRLSSHYGAEFNYISGNAEKINKGGYLSGSTADVNEEYIAHINALAIDSENRQVKKLSKSSGGDYITQNASPGEIKWDTSYTAYGEGKGIYGCNLKDAESSYSIKQGNAQELNLIMHYENCLLTGASLAGKEIIFDKDGYVSVSGDKADFSLGMTFNNDYPTDWFALAVTGAGVENAELKMTENGYLLSATQLKNVSVVANNKDTKAITDFSTEYNQVYLYEVDEHTIGVAVDTDDDGTFETDLTVENDSTKKLIPGDVNNDKIVNAVDSSMILQEYALLSTDNDFTFTDNQKITADVNNDSMIDAVDASLVLQYYAYVSTEGKGSAEEYFSKNT